jgi:hypothetical protein
VPKRYPFGARWRNGAFSAPIVTSRASSPLGLQLSMVSSTSGQPGQRAGSLRSRGASFFVPERFAELSAAVATSLARTILQCVLRIRRMRIHLKDSAPCRRLVVRLLVPEPTTLLCALLSPNVPIAGTKLGGFDCRSGGGRIQPEEEFGLKFSFAIVTLGALPGLTFGVWTTQYSSSLGSSNQRSTREFAFGVRSNRDSAALSTYVGSRVALWR